MGPKTETALAYALVPAVIAVGVWYVFQVGNSVGGLTEPNTVVLQPKDLQTVYNGQQLYMDHCASCHGDNLEGQPNWDISNANGTMPAPPHDGSGHTWHHSSAVLFKAVKMGLVQAAGLKDVQPSAMPSFGGILADQEIIAVLSFIKSKWPEEIQRKHDELDQSATMSAHLHKH
ncbi:cytochrome c [Roseibium denhamense]|uniref:c-type cytochrome n=1 Tax=Roseibium denhamense TaxID=76305 RepID=UPI0012BD541F|nr:cytochrome c [Roseibium denhamense]MTI05162.1 cytochrome c [Roseibium denhamense]